MNLKTQLTVEVLATELDHEFTRWALQWLSADPNEVLEHAVAGMYEGPAQQLRQSYLSQMIECGYIQTVEPVAKLTSSQSWEDEWISECGGSWPVYEIELHAPGMEAIDLAGWHCVGDFDDHNGTGWEVRDDDSQFTGLPRLSSDGDRIECGDNLSGSCDIPIWQHEGQWWTLDTDTLEDVIQSAADQTDHGGRPRWHHVDRDEMTVKDDFWIIQDNRVVFVELLHGGLAPLDSRDGKGDTTYYAEAWSHSLTEETFETLGECLDDLAEYADNEAVYDDETKAQIVFGAFVEGQVELPEGFTSDTDDYGYYLSHDDDDDTRWHPTSDDLAAVLSSGSWMAVIDELTSKFGVRRVLDLNREWQSQMDYIIEKYNPWVVFQDSRNAGNCAQGTEAFTAKVSESIGAAGPCGAARASLILSVADNAYTRRACRMAAQRLADEVILT